MWERLRRRPLRLRRRARATTVIWSAAAVAAPVLLDLAAPTARGATALYLGATGTWSDPTKWNTNPIVPNNGAGGQNYDVFVNVPGSYTLTLNTSISVNSLVLSGGGATFLHAAGGLLNIVGPIDVDAGVYRFTGGTLTAAQLNVNAGGSLSIGGTGGAILTDGARINGDVNFLENNARVTFRSGAGFTGDATFSGTGNQLAYLTGGTLAAGQSILMDNTGGRIDVSSTDGVNATTLTIAAGASIAGRGTLSADTNGAANGNAIVNNGQITGNNAAGRMAIEPDVFVNNGTVSLTTGTLSIGAGSWTTLGAGRIVQSDGTLLLGGTFELDTANLTRTGGTVTVSGTVNNAGRNFAITNATGSIRFNGGTFNGGSVTQSGTAALVFGTNAATFANGATFVGNLSMDDANGKVVFAGGGNFTGNAALNSTNNQIGYVYDATLGGTRTITFNNTGGRLDISGNGTLASTLTIGPDVVVRSLNRGTLSSDTFAAADGNRIVNNGLLISDDPAAALGIEPDVFINNGTVSANNGTVVINAASWSSAGSGRMILNTGTLVLGGNVSTAGLNLPNLTRTGGTLTLSGNVDNAGATLALTDSVGVVRFPGTISGGTITQTANGRLQFVSQTGTINNGAVIVGGIEFDVNSGRLFFRTGADFTGDATLTNNSTALGYGYNHTIGNNRTINLVGTSARLDVSGEGADPNTLTLAPGTTVRGRGIIGSDGFVAAAGNQIINRGLILADVSAGTLSVEPDVLTNLGTISAANNGRVNVVNVVGNTGTLTADGQGSAVRVLGGVYTLDQRITARNRGLINLQGKPAKAADFDASGVILFNYSGASPLADFQQQLGTGRAGGAWNGPGIMATLASQGAFAGRTGVGLAEATDFNFATYAGDPVDSSTLILRFTLNGDANLDLSVNIADFSLLGANFNQPNKRWVSGDFNYDGTTGIGDFALLAANFNQTLPLAAADGAVVSGGTRGSPVPEPAVFAPGSVIAATLLSRWRRQTR